MTIKEDETLNQWYIALYFYIPKKDGLLWLVQDYKRQNTSTSWILSGAIITYESRKETNEKQYFKKMKAYLNLKVMYFELYNSPGIFQRIMNSIFWELLYKRVLENYMDDFVILAKTKKELEKQTIWFSKIAEKYNLCFKWSKCNFDAEEIPILGVLVGREEVWIENNKVKAVTEWKTPTKIKEIESFLEFTNFYQQFIKNFNYTARPLNELKEKKEWKWDNELREKITSQSILTLLKRNGKFQVEMNTLKHAIGGVLL